MIPIYLCEDNQEELEYLKHIIQNYILIEEAPFQIVCASISSEDLLASLPSRGESAVFFLDIELNCDMDGIQLAAQIRRSDPRAFIIFTSVHEEMMLTTFQYKVEALDFILKDEPNFIESIRNCLNNVLQKIRVPSNTISPKIRFCLGDRELFLPVSDILYIQTIESHKIEIHAIDGIYQCSMNLKDAAQLWDGFLLCHRAVLVNSLHIKEISKTPCEIVLDNGNRCPCSVRRYAQISKML